MKLKKYLAESLNLNFPVDVLSKKKSEFITFWFVEDKDGNPIEYTMRTAKKMNWEVDFFADEFEFGMKGSLGVRGAMEVISGAATSVKMFIESNKPDFFYFTAKEPSRQKLYKKLSALITKTGAYNLEEVKSGGMVIFQFTKK